MRQEVRDWLRDFEVLEAPSAFVARGALEVRSLCDCAFAGEKFVAKVY
ncbi:hypothetical protein [Roseococcus sp. YIM B11640]